MRVVHFDLRQIRIPQAFYIKTIRKTVELLVVFRYKISMTRYIRLLPQVQYVFGGSHVAKCRKLFFASNNVDGLILKDGFDWLYFGLSVLFNLHAQPGPKNDFVPDMEFPIRYIQRSIIICVQTAAFRAWRNQNLPSVIQPQPS